MLPFRLNVELLFGTNSRQKTEKRTFSSGNTASLIHAVAHQRQNKNYLPVIPERYTKKQWLILAEQKYTYRHMSACPF